MKRELNEKKMFQDTPIMIDEILLNLWRDRYIRNSADEISSVVSERIVLFQKYFHYNDLYFPIITSMLVLNNIEIEKEYKVSEILKITKDISVFYANSEEYYYSIFYNFQSLYSPVYLLFETVYHVVKKEFPMYFYSNTFTRLVIELLMPLAKELYLYEIYDLLLYHFPIQIEFFKDMDESLAPLSIIINDSSTEYAFKKAFVEKHSLVEILQNGMNKMIINGNVIVDYLNVEGINFIETWKQYYYKRYIRNELNLFKNLHVFKITVRSEQNDSIIDICYDVYHHLVKEYPMLDGSLVDYLSKPYENNVHFLEYKFSPDMLFLIVPEEQKLKQPSIATPILQKKIISKALLKRLSNYFPESHIIKKKSSCYLATRLDKFEDYIDVVTRLQDFARSTGHTLLFRGQCKDYPLKPSLYRTNIQFELKLKQIENEIVDKFYEIGYRHLKLESSYSSIDKLAICQHYGLPTRLLDWTDNPLIALWFACSNINIYPFNNPIIWCYLVNSEKILLKSEDVYMIKNIRIYKPKHLIDRIDSQSGWFSIHPLSEFDKLGMENQSSEFLYKLSVNSESKKMFLKKLNLLNINDYSVMCDLDGLSKWIKNKYNF